MRSCQDVSAAGKRAGIKDGTRSGLWSVFAEAIDVLRPQYVVIENVRGLLSAAAHRTVEDDAGDYLEPDPAGVGNGAGRPVLRAAGAVLGDLADLGYDAQWATVAAADVGAPHRRERVFILAEAADPEGARRRVWDTAHVGQADREVNAFADDCGIAVGAKPEPGRGDAAFCGTCGHEQRLHCDWIGRCTKPCECPGFAAPHSSRNGWDEGRPESAGIVGGFDAAVSGDEPGVALLPTPVSRDGKDTHSSQRMAEKSKLTGIAHLLPTPRTSDTNGAGHHGDGGMDLRATVTLPLNAEVMLLPTPNASDGSGGGQHPDKRAGHSRQLIDYVLSDSTAWGKYAPAIARWEQVTGQPAQPPTEPNKNGNPRLSAAFSEWLMGWPPGWVTDPAIGISRNDQLRCVGNGVVSLQAVAAIRYLLAVTA